MRMLSQLPVEPDQFGGEGGPNQGLTPPRAYTYGQPHDNYQWHARAQSGVPGVARGARRV